MISNIHSRPWPLCSSLNLAWSRAQSTNDDLMLEEVTVTAQRRAERLQDVPVAVTAFTAAEIEARGIGSTRDILPMTPNVTYDESFTVGNSFVSIRGVAQINNADSPVAIVVDGVPQNSQKQLRMELFDVERIEVLKGPQGALYGRNAIGGAINIVTREPTNEFDGWAAGRRRLGQSAQRQRRGVRAHRRGQAAVSFVRARTRTATATSRMSSCTRRSTSTSPRTSARAS